LSLSRCIIGKENISILELIFGIIGFIDTLCNCRVDLFIFNVLDIIVK
jgi:hypothetical protein